MIEFLKKVSLFSRLGPDQLQLISSISMRKSYSASTVLFRENDPGSTFYIVYSGSVKVFTSHGGDEKILTVFQSGDSFGELSLIDGKPRSASAQTLEDSQLISISAPAFHNLLRTNFELCLDIMRELCERLRETNQHVHDLTFLDAKSRVIKNLIRLANRHGTRQGTSITIKVSLNYDELAQMSGCQKPILMEVMRDLQGRGIVVVLHNGFRLELSRLRS
ncbi:Crp/Fnr family transcriptional regulator [Gorillibacterium sp. sgz5001074]|uniref:Crp/Fnr family transcriptional regulator n=1 Tax=Gorillibacterium sp. sgz5001074 TaxID=3446695 RepID=UPI003F677774